MLEGLILSRLCPAGWDEARLDKLCDNFIAGFFHSSMRALLGGAPPRQPEREDDEAAESSDSAPYCAGDAERLAVQSTSEDDDVGAGACCLPQMSCSCLFKQIDV
jgi:hypothetical protein